MKLDPGIHIVKHLVFFGKSGVTQILLELICTGSRQYRRLWKCASDTFKKDSKLLQLQLQETQLILNKETKQN
jgi:hypothetical protein